MPHLELRLLGPPRVLHAGQPLELPTRKALALLLYLAAEGGVQPREKLARMLWPERERPRMLANLRTALSHLRAALEAQQDDGAPHLRVETESLVFNQESDYRLDLELLRAAAAGRELKPNDPGAAVQVLADAWSLYRGPFLDGFSLSDASEFEAWLQGERDLWVQRADRLLAELTELQMMTGRPAQAFESIQEWLQVNPLSERAYRRLMRVQLQRGDRAAALRAYERCRAALEGHLGLELSERTQQLAARIQRGSVDSVEVPTDRKRASAGLDLSELPLVGREGAHARLVDAYQAVQREGCQLLLLEGEPGVGKTRLVAEFSRWVGSRGGLVLRGRSSAPAGGTPYGALAQALRAGMEDVVSTQETLDRPWRRELARLLPELEDANDPPPNPAPEAALAATRLRTALIRLGESLAEWSGVLLALDDLHAADAATLEFVGHAAARWQRAGAPVLILASVRSAPLGAAVAGTSSPTPFQDWWASLASDTPLAQISLAPLTVDHVSDLAWRLPLGQGQSVGPGPTGVAAFVEWLLAESGGNPLHLSLIIQALADEGLLQERRAEDGRAYLDVTPALDPAGAAVAAELQGFLPPGIEQLTQRRYAGLGRAARAALNAASILAQPASLELVEQVAELDRDSAVRGVEELSRSGVLRSEPDGYRFAHEKMRRVARGHLSGARRRDLHRRALAAGREYGSPAAELARHARGASYPELAFQHDVAAAAHALELSAVRDSIRHFARAWDFMLESDDLELELDELERLGFGLARAYEIVGELEAAEEVLAEVRRRAGASEDLVLECMAINRLAFVLAHQHRPQEAAQFLDRALELARRAEAPRALAETHWSLAQRGLYDAAAESVEEHARRALRLAEELEDEELGARCRNVLSYVARNRGAGDEAAEHAHRARAIYRAAGDLAMESDCLGALAQAELLRARPVCALRRAASALRMSRRVESEHGIGAHTLELVLAQIERGLLGDALGLAREGAERARAGEGAVEFVLALIALGRAQRAVHKFEAAETTHRQALELVESDGIPFTLGPLLAGDLAADMGPEVAAAAAEWACKAVLTPDEPTFLLGALLPWWTLVESLIEAESLDRAERMVAEVAQYADGAERLRLAHLACSAIAASHKGDLSTAKENLERSLRAVRDSRLLPMRRRVELLLAEVYRRQGRSDDADEMGRAARSTLAHLADMIEEREIRESFLVSADRQ